MWWLYKYDDLFFQDQAYQKLAQHACQNISPDNFLKSYGLTDCLEFKLTNTYLSIIWVFKYTGFRFFKFKGS